MTKRALATTITPSATSLTMSSANGARVAGWWVKTEEKPIFPAK